MIKIKFEDLIEDQRFAESGLWDAEHEVGPWQVLKDDAESEEELEAYNNDRKESIEEYKERLKPQNLSLVHLPQLPLVRLDPNAPENGPDYQQYNVFDPKKTYLCLGEIAQMPGHVVILDYRTGQIFSGYHTERFEIIPVSEA